VSSPKGQHFLACGAYLKGFCALGKQQVWLYRRGANPVLTNIVNVAKQNRLYSVELAGEYNDDLETFFAKIDGEAAGVFQKLRGVSGTAPSLSEKELAELIRYIAFQFVRTPAFRRMREKNGTYAAVTGRTLTDEQITRLRQTVPRDLIPPGLVNSNEEFRELWREALCDVEADFADKRSWLALTHPFAEGIALVLWRKRLELIKVADEYFLTCDQPVVLDYALNFATSDVYFPIGSRAALYFDPSQARVGPNPLTLPIRNIGGSEARAFNRRIMLSAEDELYGAINRPGIQRAFSSASPPSRFALTGAVQLLGLPPD
jgi:Protein of unknown function (DUF4238)